MGNGTNPSEYYDGNILTAAINLRGKTMEKDVRLAFAPSEFQTGWMRGQSNLTPLRSKGKVMLGQVVVSLAQECLPSLCVCLCKTGSRTVTLVNTSTQASDSMGSWNVGDTGWWCFSWNRNRPAIISVFWHVEGRRFVQCWVSQLLASWKEKKWWLFSALASFLLRLSVSTCVCLSLFMRMLLWLGCEWVI